MLACDRVRDRGCVVVVGDVGVQLARTPFYLKEVDVRFARSYGPGRYERSYEEYAVDYPVGHVRWTEGRNIEAFLDLVARGRVSVDDLISHTFPIEKAKDAYETIASDDRALGIQFAYDPESAMQPTLVRQPLARRGGIGLVGAGNYAKVTFVPALKAAGFDSFAAVTSSGGLSARHLAERHDIPLVCSSVGEMLGLEDVGTIFILSRHDSHAEITQQALQAGKHVFVEKPLALSHAELSDVVGSLTGARTTLWVGFNRRHSAMVKTARETLGASGGPIVANYRVNAGRLPDSHWYKDRRQGGRLLGEVCHFIDTISWIVGSNPHSVVAFGSGRAETLLQEDLVISLRYADGSLGTVTYAEHPHSSSSKERLELSGRGHSVVIDDFQKLVIDGKRTKVEEVGKGHAENLKAFRETVESRASSVDELRYSIGSTSASLAALESLMTGDVVSVLDYDVRRSN